MGLLVDALIRDCTVAVLLLKYFFESLDHLSFRSFRCFASTPHLSLSLMILTLHNFLHINLSKRLGREEWSEVLDTRHNADSLRIFFKVYSMRIAKGNIKHETCCKTAIVKKISPMITGQFAKSNGVNLRQHRVTEH